MGSVVATPVVSVVLPTHQRRDNLPKVLAPLLEDPALREALVVVDGSHDGSLELLEGMARGDSRLRAVRTTNRGGAAARQLGIDLARGEVVLLLDDDVVASPGLVSGHARHHLAAEDLVVLGYMPTRLPEPAGSGDFATVLYAREYQACACHYEADPSRILFRLWGGNVSIRRDQLRRVPYDSGGGFARTNHSDLDFGLRCWKAGLRGVFDRSLHAVHEHHRPLAAFRRDARRQGAGRMLVHATHGDVLGPFPWASTLAGLPRPLRALLRLDRLPVVRAPLVSGLTVAARGAARTGSVSGELLAAQVLRRLEIRAGARATAATLQLRDHSATGESVPECPVPECPVPGGHRAASAGCPTAAPPPPERRPAPTGPEG